jgi:hypothetical protein
MSRERASVRAGDRHNYKQSLQKVGLPTVPII